MHTSEALQPFPNHTGAPLSANQVFFAPPPEEIGTVLSGFSTKTAGAINVTLIKGWVSAIGLGIFMAFFLGYTPYYLFGWPLAFTMPVSGVLGLLLIVGLIPRPTCTYVGTQGIARITKAKTETFLFSHDCAVGVKHTRNYHNGVYTGSHITYTFFNEATKQTFLVDSSVYEVNNKIAADSPAHFGERGELALTEYLLPQSFQRLEQGESELFEFSSGMKIELGPCSLTIQQGEKRNEIRYEDLEHVSVNDGAITLMERGGKKGFLGFGKEGVFSFAYASLPNAKLFFLLLQHQIEEAHQHETR